MGGNFRGGGVVGRGKGAQGCGQRRTARHGGFHCRAYRAGINACAAEIGAPIDAGNAEIGLVVSKKIHAEPRAVGRRSVNGVGFHAEKRAFLYAKGLCDADGVACGASFAVGRADSNAVPCLNGVFGKLNKSLCADAVVIGDENVHAFSFRTASAAR